METPESMKAELARWNGGKGIDLEGWLAGSGNYALAVGYLSLFWPGLVEFEGYVLREGFSVDSLRGFERAPGANRRGVEAVMNHLHLADLHGPDAEGFSVDKALVLGHAMKAIYEAKLAREFPHRRCAVEFVIPESAEALDEYQLTFWQIDGGDVAS